MADDVAATYAPYRELDLVTAQRMCEPDLAFAAVCKTCGQLLGIAARAVRHLYSPGCQSADPDLSYIDRMVKSEELA